jgi:hypothetical protein
MANKELKGESGIMTMSNQSSDETSNDGNSSGTSEISSSPSISSLELSFTGSPSLIRYLKLMPKYLTAGLFIWLLSGLVYLFDFNGFEITYKSDCCSGEGNKECNNNHHRTFDVRALYKSDECRFYCSHRSFRSIFWPSSFWDNQSRRSRGSRGQERAGWLGWLRFAFKYIGCLMSSNGGDSGGGRTSDKGCIFSVQLDQLFAILKLVWYVCGMCLLILTWNEIVSNNGFNIRRDTWRWRWRRTHSDD